MQLDTSKQLERKLLLEEVFMEHLKKYLLKNFEQVFVLLILLSVAGINYFVPYKLVFLNFYFIVVLIASYYLELRSALLGGVLCTLLVIVYVYFFPTAFMPAFTELDLWMNIIAWASFLILTGAVVGGLTARLRKEVKALKELNQSLQESKARIEQNDQELRGHAEKLEMWLTILAKWI